MLARIDLKFEAGSKDCENLWLCSYMLGIQPCHSLAGSKRIPGIKLAGETGTRNRKRVLFQKTVVRI